MTTEERQCIREAARRYVHEHAPVPPIAVLERVAQIVLQARSLDRHGAVSDRATGSYHGRAEAA
jgi:hypothetical protein